MVFDVALIVLPQALPRGGVEQEGEGLERDGDADVQVPVDHVVVEDAGALLPAERAPEQAGGVDAGPEDERRGDEAWEGRERSVSGSHGLGDGAGPGHSWGSKAPLWGGQRPELEPQLCPLPAGHTWVSCSEPLCLSFLICTRGATTPVLVRLQGVGVTPGGHPCRGKSKEAPSCA